MVARLGGATRAPVTADSYGSVPSSGGGSQVAGVWWCLLVGGVRLRADSLVTKKEPEVCQRSSPYIPVYFPNSFRFRLFFCLLYS